MPPLPPTAGAAHIAKLVSTFILYLPVTGLKLVRGVPHPRGYGRTQLSALRLTLKNLSPGKVLAAD
jgi:hypothetical protein